MSSFNDTAGLERALLKQLISGIVLLRLYLPRVKPEFFTSPYRQFIFDVINEAFKTSKAVLTDTVFRYEVGRRVGDDSKRAYYTAEWDIVQQDVSQENPELLISKLEDAVIGREVLSASEAAVSLLEKGDVQGAVENLKRSAMRIRNREDAKPTVELSDYEPRKRLIEDKKANPSKYLGIQTGFPSFDKRTGGLFAGELTLVAGITGVGKSTFVRQLCLNIVTLNPTKNVLYVANEEYLEQVEYKFDALFSRIPYHNFKRATISDADMLRWEEQMKGWRYGRVFIKEVPAFTDVTLVEMAYRELENNGIPIHCIIIDHLPHVKPIEKPWDLNDERAKAASDCKEIARSLRVPVVIPSQAATDVEEKQTKGQRAGRLDVYGSKAQIHVANTFVIITVKGTDASDPSVPEEERDVFWLADVKKNRDGPAFCLSMRHIVRYGNVVEVMDAGSMAAYKAEGVPDGKIIEGNENLPVLLPLDGQEDEERKAIRDEGKPGGDISFTPDEASALESAANDPVPVTSPEPTLMPEGLPVTPESLLQKLRKKNIF